MRANNILGIIFSNSYDNAFSEATGLRAIGSVPFCSRYRLIDFPLSNMVNSGITKVGIATKSNYQSLMDHLGTGKAWDLSRKREGMFFLPPFHEIAAGAYNTRMGTLIGILNFIKFSKEEFVIFSDSNFVCNFDYKELIEFHKEKDSDISIVYKTGIVPKLDDIMTFEIDENSRIKQIALSGEYDVEKKYSTNIIMMRKSLLERLVAEAISLNYKSCERDLFQRNVHNLKIYGYEISGFSETIDNLQGYYNSNRKLLEIENRKSLFNPERPILTKVRDDMPAIHGIDSKVNNSLIANGCVIDGEVENSIIFRGVRIAKGAVVKNSIIMQDTFISEDVHLDSVITDKLVVIKPGKNLSGDPSYPIYIGKSIVI